MLSRLPTLTSLFLLLVTFLLPGALAIEVKIVAASRNGSTPVNPAEIKLLRKPVTTSQLERLGNQTEAEAAKAKAPVRRTNPVGYSGNWCGASQHATRSNLFTSVEGFFTVPDLSLRPSTGTPQFVAAWIGIDGASCSTALVQAGATTEISANGQQTSNAWFEWIPNAAYGISNLPVSPGDTMHVKITSSSSSQATILVENLSLPSTAPVYSVQVSLSNGAPLCRTDAEWIVENFIINGAQTSFAKFDDVWFQGCEAKTASGGSVGINGASMIYLQNNGPNPNCFAYEYDNNIFYAQSS